MLQASAKIREFTLNLAQAAATYDVTQALSGAVFVEDWALQVSVVGAVFDSVSIQTDDTTPWELLSAVEGAVANLLDGANLQPAAKGKAFRLAVGKKIQFTLAGALGTGELKLAVRYRETTGGARLS